MKRPSLGLALYSALLGLGILFETGCGTARRSEPLVGPAPVSNPQVERGRIAFMHYCDRCHPGGEGGLGPALNNKPLPGWLIKSQVRVGLGSMPDFVIQRLPPAELDDLVAYLLVLRHHDAKSKIRSPKSEVRVSTSGIR